MIAADDTINADAEDHDLHKTAGGVKLFRCLVTRSTHTSRIMRHRGSIKQIGASTKAVPNAM